LKIVNRLTYLGVVFTTGGAFTETLTLWAGQALHATYWLENICKNVLIYRQSMF
jgi:hypothetical protein